MPTFALLKIRDDYKLAGEKPRSPVRHDGFTAWRPVRVQPAGPVEERQLRFLRDQLADVYGFRQQGHANYGFHMGMAHQLAPFTPEERSSYMNLLQQHIPKISAASPVLQLGEPEYCTFLDMFRFEPVHLLFCAS